MPHVQQADETCFDRGPVPPVQQANVWVSLMRRDHDGMGRKRQTKTLFSSALTID